DPRRAQLGALFYRPFHAIEFEDGESDRYLSGSRGGDLFPQFEFNLVGCDGDNSSPANFSTRGDVEFLADTGPKHAGEVLRMSAGQEGAIASDFVGDPATAGHRAESLTYRLRALNHKEETWGVLSENVFHFSQQRPALGFVLDARRTLQFAQQLALALVELVG